MQVFLLLHLEAVNCSANPPKKFLACLNGVIQLTVEGKLIDLVVAWMSVLSCCRAEILIR